VSGTMSLAGEAVVTEGRADAMAPNATTAPRPIATPPRMTLDLPRTADAYTPSSTGTARNAMRNFRNTRPGLRRGERRGWGFPLVARNPLGRLRSSG